MLGKLAYDRRQRFARTISVIELAASILLDHPPLFILCLALIATFVIITAPFISILSRLLSIGLASQDGWHPTHHSTILAGFVAFVWLWSLGVVRGIQRITVAGVVGHWFFSRHEPSAPSPTELVMDSFTRARGPSLGTACCSALLLAFLDTIAIGLHYLRELTRPSNRRLPECLHPLYVIGPIFALLASIIETLSSYALVYAGVTGDDFFASARHAASLIVRTGTGRVVDCR